MLPFPPSLHDDKTVLRNEMRRRRGELSDAIGGEAAESAALRVMELVTRLVAREAAVAGYWPVGSELDCRPALLALTRAGWRCCLPVVTARDQPMVFREWQPGLGLVRGMLGTLEPPADCDSVVPALALLPLLAFDSGGRRLGQGAGCYDRTLAELRRRQPVMAVGLAFAGQEVDRLPAEAHDVPLDAIITERYTLSFSPLVPAEATGTPLC